MNNDIFRLYSRPSFLDGVTRLFNFHGLITDYKYSRSNEEADYRAIESDWMFVGDDIKNAIIEFSEKSESLDRVSTEV